MIKIGAIYEHYKGKKYKIIALARHTETLEECVVYQALYYDDAFGDNALWIRPATMFMESTEYNGILQPRFKLCSLEI